MHPDVFMGVFDSAYSAVSAYRKRVVEWDWKSPHDPWEPLTEKNAEKLALGYGPAHYRGTGAMYDMVIRRTSRFGFKKDDGK